jgi:hypothetical protein
VEVHFGYIQAIVEEGIAEGARTFAGPLAFAFAFAGHIDPL